MRILVLGAGGIGGYFGGRLAESGVDVTFLVRPARARRLQADGLIIQSPLGDAVVKVRTVTRGTLDRGYDLVLFTCKAYDLESAIAAIRPAVTSATSILPLLNGLVHLDGLGATFGPDAVLGGLAHISTTLAPDGRILHLNKLQALTFGARLPIQQARSDAVEALFRQTSFEQRDSAAIMQEMWEKFAFITAAAAITCLMRAPIGDILEAADGERLILQMLAECEAVAAASGLRDWRESARLGEAVPDATWVGVHGIHAARPSERLEGRGGSSSGRHDPAWKSARRRRRAPPRRVLPSAGLRERPIPRVNGCSRHRPLCRGLYIN